MRTEADLRTFSQLTLSAIWCDNSAEKPACEGRRSRTSSPPRRIRQWRRPAPALEAPAVTGDGSSWPLSFEQPPEGHSLLSLGILMCVDAKTGRPCSSPGSEIMTISRLVPVTYWVRLQGKTSFFKLRDEHIGSGRGDCGGAAS